MTLGRIFISNCGHLKLTVTSDASNQWTATVFDMNTAQFLYPQPLPNADPEPILVFDSDVTAKAFAQREAETLLRCKIIRLAWRENPTEPLAAA